MGLAPGSAVVPSAAVRLRRAPVHQHSRVVPLHRDAESELPLVAVVRHLRRRRLLRPRLQRRRSPGSAAALSRPPRDLPERDCV